MRAFTVPALTLLLGLLPAAALAGETRAGDLTVVDPWARATIGNQNVGAAYVTIRNRGAAADRLVGVRTDAAEDAALHTSTVTSAGVAEMRPVDSIEIPPGGEAKLAPRGTHIMLMGLKAPLVAGKSFPLTLEFARAGAVEVEARVEGGR
jgi:copper(I)-binding protein